LPANAARCSSLSPLGVLSAISSARRATGKLAVACARTAMRPPEKSARTPSTPSSEVPDIRPMKSSSAIAGSEKN
jgi:hypothetical protein